MLIFIYNFHLPFIQPLNFFYLYFFSVPKHLHSFFPWEKRQKSLSTVWILWRTVGAFINSASFLVSVVQRVYVKSITTNTERSCRLSSVVQQSVVNYIFVVSSFVSTRLISHVVIERCSNLETHSEK